MKRPSMTVTIALSAATAAMIFSASAFAKGQGPGGVGSERPSFSELDANGDGNLTIAEMQAKAAARFQENDSNGDGVLSSDEMVAAAVAKAGDRAEQAFAQLLEWRDSDGDGSLNQAELGDNRAERLFSRVDADNDGVVTAEEFEQAQAKFRGSRSGPGRRGDHKGRNGG
jgi:Ca2+-binding EF-hand superfamily protein